LLTDPVPLLWVPQALDVVGLALCDAKGVEGITGTLHNEALLTLVTTESQDST
jgi:hypothetical protein